jgi:MFS family permease
MTIQKTLSRDFILSFLAQFAFSCVFSILIPTIPIYLSHFEAKEAEIGFLVGIFSVSSLILRPFVGRALLRTPEKKFMVAGTAVYVLSCLAYILAPPFWPLLIVRVFHGIGLALFSTASFTLIANITPVSYRGQFVSYFYLSNNLSFALGPFFGMLLINHFSLVVLFLTCTGLSLCSFFIAMKLGKNGAAPSQDEPIKAQPFLSREALPCSIISFMLNIIWGSLSAFFPLYALKHGVSNPGIFFIFLAITLILGRSLGGRVLDLYDRKKLIMSCLFVIIVSIVILPFSNSLKMFILAAIILGAGWAFLYPSLMIYVMEKAETAQGPAMATFTALGDLGAGVGPMIMGIILEWTSYPVMFFCLILVGVTNFVYFYYAIWKEAKDIREEVKEGKIALKSHRKPLIQLRCEAER